MDVEQAFEAVQEHVGRTYRRELGVLDELALQRFAVAVGVELPVDPETEGTVTAPPLYLSSVMGWDPGPAEDELRPDGAAREQLADVPVEGLRLMGAGQSLEFLQPVVAGMAVTQETRVDDVQLKEGRSGSMLILKLERLFTTDDVPLVRCVETFIGR